MAGVRAFRVARMVRDLHWVESFPGSPMSTSSLSSFSLCLVSGRSYQVLAHNGCASLLSKVCQEHAPSIRALNVQKYEWTTRANTPAVLRWSSTEPLREETAEPTPQGEGHSKEGTGSVPEQEEEVVDEKTEVLGAALAHVLRLGWTEEALVAGARDVGLSPAIVGSFPRKEAALVEFFMDDCNHRLADELESREQELSVKLLADRIASIVRWRLEMQVPYMSKWAQALSIQANPLNVPTALKQRAVLMDDIWHGAGDRSADMDWYTKRALLGAVYSATELYLLTDFSPGYRDSWVFLEGQIKDVINLRKTAQEATQLAQAVGLGLGRSISSFFKRQTSSPRS